MLDFRIPYFVLKKHVLRWELGQSRGLLRPGRGFECFTNRVNDNDRGFSICCTVKRLTPQCKNDKNVCTVLPDILSNFENYSTALIDWRSTCCNRLQLLLATCYLLPAYHRLVDSIIRPINQGAWFMAKKIWRWVPQAPGPRANFVLGHEP